MSARILTGDCRSVLKDLPDESVHCVVTSPPYFGLRDYGTAQWEGGEAGCEHIKGTAASTTSTLKNDGRVKFGSNDYEHSIVVPYRDVCGHCGARRIDSQIGLEPTPAAYVAEMVAVFREVRRVLRSDGVCFLNLGDSYAGSWGNQGRKDERGTQRPINGPMLQNLEPYPDKQSNTGTIRQPGLKPKDLIGIPWRVAFALQADGWWLRSEIIWHKPNPMPESVTDRPTKSHEQIFLLTKSATYHYDAEAIAETSLRAGEIHGGDNERGVNEFGVSPHAAFNGPVPATRNRRSVWTVATQPFSEAHFATFPPALIEPCILAGCPAKCCAKCGAPWVREVEREKVEQTGVTPKQAGYREQGLASSKSTIGRTKAWAPDEGRVTTLGFSPSCACNAATMPGTALDPFFGAGTTGLVADRLQRNCIGIELNESYATMARNRIHNDAPLFAEAAE